MSQETSQWLNQNTLIGFTEKRGFAWHHRKSDQGAEPNHYIGAIPIEDVRRRLFPWEAVSGRITATALTADGVLVMEDPLRQAIMRSDTGAILGVFKAGYQIHQFEAWLLDTVATILDDELSIGSAGLLRGGAVAWVSVEVPDSIMTPEGVEFRPNLLATTSHDGSLASTFKRVVQIVVCDNTLAAGLSEKGQTIKVKHSRYSNLKLQEARDALEIVHEIADDFMAEVAQLTNITVTDDQWRKFLSELVPMPTDDGRAKTIAVNKHAKLNGLWEHDDRVTPWKNTGYGVLAAVNTAHHHVLTVHGNRVERNMLRALDGGVDRLDSETLSTLARVLDQPVLVAA